MKFPPEIALRTSLMAAAILVAGSASAENNAQGGSIVYKLIDEQGRVTYSNQPLKGGTKIELEPLTVIPSTPSGLPQPVARTSATRTPVAIVTPLAPPIAPPLREPAPVATPLAAPTPASYVAPAAASVLTPLPAAPTIGAYKVAAMEALTLARREELRPALQDEELQRTEKLLAGAQAQLEIEQGRREEIRALRVTHATPAETAAGSRKPVMSPDVRQHIERHFERIRDLQDEIAMHEDNLQRLRARAEPDRVSSSN